MLFSLETFNNHIYSLLYIIYVYIYINSESSSTADKQVHCLFFSILKINENENLLVFKKFLLH